MYSDGQQRNTLKAMTSCRTSSDPATCAPYSGPLLRDRLPEVDDGRGCLRPSAAPPARERTAKKESTDGRNDLVPHRRTGGTVRGQFRVRLRAGEVGRTLKGRTNHEES